MDQPSVFVGLALPALKLWGVALAMMTALWGISLILRDASIVDRFWGMGFLLLFLFQLVTDCRFLTFRSTVILGLVATWAVRLSLYIHFRNRNHPEDARYRKMRASIGPRFWWVSLFTVFFLQGTLMWLISAPLIAVLLFPQSDAASPLDYVGVTLWVAGFLWEAIGDFQLARFKSRPESKGQVCRDGLWNWSRHPNYFGEALLWWGYGVLALNTSGGWFTLYSPILMTYLLLRVSGVSLLEKQLRQTKPGYAEYISTVPAFFPRPPR